MKKLIINKGDRFGKLIYLEDGLQKILPSGQKPRVALCRCDCGNSKEILVLHLTRGRTVSCGDCYLELPKEKVVGNKYATLTIIKELAPKVAYGRHLRFVEAVCDCGKFRKTTLNNIKRLKSCGCLSKALTLAAKIKHGQSGTRIHGIWLNMKRRCDDPKIRNYVYYGGRGIYVCKEWVNDFKVFYEWAMQNGYSDTLTIDRINVNGNYEPSNCRWATYEQQANNKTTTIYCTYKNETLAIADLARKYHIPLKRLWTRLHVLGWDITKAIETERLNPVDNFRNKIKK